MQMFRRSHPLIGLAVALTSTFGGSALAVRKHAVLGYVTSDKKLVSSVDASKLDQSARNLLPFLNSQVLHTGEIPKGAPRLVYDPHSDEVTIVNPNESHRAGNGKHVIADNPATIKEVGGENIVYPKNLTFDPQRIPNKWEQRLRDTLEVVGHENFGEVFISTGSIDPGIPGAERFPFFHASQPGQVGGYVDLVPFRRGMHIRQILDSEKKTLWIGPTINREQLDKDLVRIVQKYSRPERARDVFMGRRPIDVHHYGHTGKGYKTLTYEFFENVSGNKDPQKLGTVKVDGWGDTLMKIFFVVDNNGEYLRKGYNVTDGTLTEHYLR